ncbi:C-X-C motif chemokine 6-like [Carlito syrichta]|uniref:C-X-C motif chemokine n=1 Tax=Carlito syrichta TaxID=1868482 RepID=A0A3Q0DUT0_CARSF|nr:C-X-C motif chemokine 6-like [Carlito syrichta]
MSLSPRRSARVPGPQGSLCALLALLLLAPPGPFANAGPGAAVVRELRCVCLRTTPGIHPKMVSSVQVIDAGPHCAKVEVVASLKNGREVCLDPEAPLIKKVLQRILDRLRGARGGGERQGGKKRRERGQRTRAEPSRISALPEESGLCPQCQMKGR